MKIRLIKNVTFNNVVFKNNRIEDVDADTAKKLISCGAAMPIEIKEAYKIVDKVRKT